MKAEKRKRKLNYITLIWEELPELISLYVVPRSEITKADIKMLNTCNNNYVNSATIDSTFASEMDVNISLCRLNNMILDTSLEWVNDSYKNEQADFCNITRVEFDIILGKWDKFKIRKDSTFVLPRSKLYRSGFYS